MNLISLNYNNFLKSIAAGICISLGCICYLSIENKIIGSFLFSVGLLSILNYGLVLYTGRIGLSKSIEDIFVNLCYFIGNVIGCAITYYIALQSILKYDVNVKLQNIVADKLTTSTFDLFILGVFCGVLMYYATKTYKNNILPILCVMAFILIGAEHSVADAFYMLAANDVIGYFKVIIPVILGNSVGAITINKLVNTNTMTERIIYE